uniref:G protein-coupled receptor kinase 4 n=2 Tax=Cercopithecinae TaxID=9528 RepID=A0A2I3M3V9_PAPAN
MELENIMANSLLLKARQVLCLLPQKHQLVQPFSGRPPQSSLLDLMSPLLASQESWQNLGPQVPMPATVVLHTPSLLRNC